MPSTNADAISAWSCTRTSSALAIACASSRSSSAICKTSRVFGIPRPHNARAIGKRNTRPVRLCTSSPVSGRTTQVASVNDSTVVPTHPDQGSLCLGEPKVHLHVAIQGYGGTQGGVRLLALAGRGIEYTQAPVTVGLERAHAEFLGQGKGLPVVGFGPLAWRRPLGRDLAKESQGVGFVAPFLMRPGELQRALRLGIRFVQTASEEIRLAQPDHKGCLEGPFAHSLALSYCLLEQWQRLGQATRQRIRVPHAGGEVRDPVAEVVGLAHGQAPLAYRNSLREIALMEGQPTHPKSGHCEAEGMLHPSKEKRAGQHRPK